MSLIDREGAIRLVASYPGPVDKSVVRRILTQMDAAQPESEERIGESEQNVPKEDLISRKAAIDAVYGRIRQIGYENNPLVLSIRQAIRELPTAKPERKRGRWSGNNACPFCGFQPWFERDIHTLSFCPNCGADMR